MDYVKHNSNAWDNEVKEGNQWTKEVSKEIIERAKKGEWGIFLTPTKKVPINWFGDIKGKKILCLASGGGQQAPILSAIGGKVTVFDNSIEQLNKDIQMIKEDGKEHKITESTTNKGKSLYRIFIGPYEGYSKAQEDLERVNEKFKVKGLIKKL